MPGALQDIRVIDATVGMPGRIATMMLADHGADVIRLEIAGRGTLDDGRCRTWGRGRRLIHADPVADRSVVERLVAGSDLIVAGPDLDDLPVPLRRDSVLSINPDVVYVALSAYGLSDSRSTRAVEPLVAAEAGAMASVSPVRRDGPVFLGHPAITYSTAMLAVIGALAALRARVVSGRGDVVDTSILDGIRALSTMNWWAERDVAFLTARRDDGQLDLGRTRMLVRRYTCGDGGLIQVHTGAPGAFGRLMSVLGVADRISPADGPVENACPLTDVDLEVIATLPEVFSTRPLQEWLEALWADQIAALPVLRPGEVFDVPHVRERGLIREFEDDLGTIEVVGPPLILDRSPATLTEADTVVDASRIAWHGAGLEAGGDTALPDGPLSGVNIVEFSTFFASPYANRLLRDLGARVDKVEAIAGDPMRGLSDPFEGACRGKRSIAVDLKSPESRPLVEALVRRADVVQHNFRPGVAERLGLDEPTLRTVNPALIYDYAPGYGANGPMSGLQSFAPLQSGFVGITTEASGIDNQPTLTFGNEDYYNGLLNAIGELLALVHRERTGEGQYVEGAQLSSSVFVTSHWYLDHGVPHSTLPALDAEQLGWSWCQRLYQCLTGYLCVYCDDDEEAERLREVILGSGDDSAVEASEAISYEMFARTAEEWVDVLRDAGVPCAVAIEEAWLIDHLADPVHAATGRADRFEHHDHGPVSVIGDLVHLASHPRSPAAHAPRLGEHTTQILRELGLDDRARRRLLDKGAVFGFGPTPDVVEIQ